MKIRKMWITIILLLTLVGSTSIAGASDPWYDELVPHVLGFEIPTGQYCVTDYRDGKPFTTCYCPCDGCVDEVVTIVEPVDTPTKEPTPDPTPIPPTQKSKCNSGRGNGSEGEPDCDPGNSGGHNKGGD